MMLEKKITEFIDILSSSAPTPGGGGASAAVGAFAAALGMMVGNLTVGKKKYVIYEEEIKNTLSRLEKLRNKLVNLADEDAKAFEPLSRAYKLPKDTEEEQREKERVMEKALYEASIVPLEIMETIMETMECLKVMGEKGSRLAVSDVGTAILFAQAALEGASLNIFINTKLMKDRECAETLNQKAEDMILSGEELKKTVYADTLEKIK